MPEMGGKVGARGAARAEQNPGAAPRAGARYEGAEIVARLTGEGLSVRVIGRATYGGRTLSTGADLDAGAHDVIRAELEAALVGAADEIEGRTMEAAYEAARVARLRGEV